MLKLNIKLLLLDKPARLIVRLFFTVCLLQQQLWALTITGRSPAGAAVIVIYFLLCQHTNLLQVHLPCYWTIYNGNVNQFTRQISPRCTTQVLTRTIAGIIDRWRISLDFANSLLTDFKWFWCWSILRLPRVKSVLESEWGNFHNVQVKIFKCDAKLLTI